MKRFLSLVLITVLAVTMIVSCEADKLQEASVQDIYFAAEAIYVAMDSPEEAKAQEAKPAFEVGIPAADKAYEIPDAIKFADNVPLVVGTRGVDEVSVTDYSMNGESNFTINNLKCSDDFLSFTVNGKYSATVDNSSSYEKFTLNITDINCECETTLTELNKLFAKEVVIERNSDDDSKAVYKLNNVTLKDEDTLRLISCVLEKIQEQFEKYTSTPNSTVYGTTTMHLINNISFDIEDGNMIRSMENIDLTMTMDNSSSGVKRGALADYTAIFMNNSVVTLNAVINGKKTSIEYSSIKDTLKLNGKKYSCPFESVYPIIVKMLEKN